MCRLNIPSITIILLRELLKKPRALYANQFGNPANVLAHEKTTGPEIWEQMNHDLDAFVAGVGSGGTLTGVGKFLKSVSPKTKIAADPEGSIIYDAVKRGLLNIKVILAC